MPTVTTKDGVEIFYKDWGSGQAIVFSHGWPLSADVWLLPNAGISARGERESAIIGRSFSLLRRAETSAFGSNLHRTYTERKNAGTART